ncbi:MAG: DUF4932 domain-containing protein [Chitinophagaceae bacterium]|nr:DUF4932 domain-containing protein [Chitinophagaceae bacterium]
MTTLQRILAGFIITCCYNSCALHPNNSNNNNIPGNKTAAITRLSGLDHSNLANDDKNIAVKQIQVKINKNIELFGLIMQLNMGEDLANSNDTLMIDNQLSTWKDWYRLAWNNYTKYKKFNESSLMKLYRSYSQKGFYDDFFIGFLLQVDEVPAAKLNSTTDKEVVMTFSASSDYTSAQKAAAKFLEEFNAFYKELKFADYLMQNEDNYKRMVADVIKNLPSETFLPAMETFYQKAFQNYFLVPGFNIPTSMGFGKMNRNTQSIYNVFGPFTFQRFETRPLQLGFDDPSRIQNLSVHEFGHSFVNPAVDQLPEELVASTDYLFTPIKEAMSKLAYPSWKICLYEHFVKAGEVILAEKLGKKENAENLLKESVAARFIYLPFIVEELRRYDANKITYPSYEVFIRGVLEKLKKRQPNEKD